MSNDRGRSPEEPDFRPSEDQPPPDTPSLNNPQPLGKPPSDTQPPSDTPSLNNPQPLGKPPKIDTPPKSAPRAPETPDDLGIEFGDVEQAAPDQCVRPDRNKHYAVVPVGKPTPDDLPIYVDIDAMLDMERHALSDTSVELGGVMLGGQYVDDRGKDFVLVSDSLRAAHYESTKGSFKFTHDTWSKISREREEFPENLQMVGWYHTHPDWGVFLSGMDMFICDNFFNGPLDVALVIDPCRQDRGMFMWTNNPAQRVRRTDGFYLVGSRFRIAELERVASHLEGTETMALDPRYGSSGGSVVNVGGSPPWIFAAVLGMLALQACLVCLLAWKVLTPQEPAEDEKAKQQMAEIEERLEEISRVREDRLLAESQLRVMDQMMSQLPGGRSGAVQELAEQQRELEQLRASLRGLQSRERELTLLAKTVEAEKKQAVADLKIAAASHKTQEADLKKESAELTKDKKKLATELASLKKKYGIADKDDEGEGESGYWKWYYTAAAAGLLFLLAGAGAAYSARRGSPPGEEPQDAEADDQPK